jgi:transcriptional regulator with XRE-family HTH domain
MYPNLRAEIARKGVTATAIADALVITKGTLSLKMQGKSAFTVPEAKAIKKLLDADVTIDELFDTMEG